MAPGMVLRVLDGNGDGGLDCGLWSWRRRLKGGGGRAKIREDGSMKLNRDGWLSRIEFGG